MDRPLVQAVRDHAAVTTPVHRCHAVGCPTSVPPRLLMCAEHWRMVPAALRAGVWSTYKPGQEVTKVVTPAYVCAAARAIVVVAWVEGRDAPAQFHRFAQGADR